ncbi:hypothetical protein VSR34_13175 [Paraburkholderia sp. JHI2823]|jgi:hypothetical protein|uniref:hypothetical protein n=1 Tax=Paraburkholderia TaxID=1822464 RepID=UPI00041BE6E4|nr:hypothetical protein [Paraburkholderia mimosarum]
MFPGNALRSSLAALRVPLFDLERFDRRTAQIIPRSFWAGALPTTATKRSLHYIASSAIAFKSICVLVRCWQMRMRQNETVYLTVLRKRASRLFGKLDAQMSRLGAALLFDLA